MCDDREPLTRTEKIIQVLAYVYVISWVAIVAAAAVWIVREVV